MIEKKTSESYRIILCRFLATLFIAILLLINGGRILFFRKRRNKFLNLSKKINQTSTVSMINSKSKQIYIPSSLTDETSFTLTTTYRSTSFTKPKQSIMSTPNSIIDLKDTFDQSNKITKKEFQQQPLAEHNLIRVRYNKQPLKLIESLNIYAQVNFFIFIY